MTPPWPAARELERFLGDPLDPASRISFRAQVRSDEREEPDGSAVDALREWGFPDFLVPQDVGGRLGSADELFALLRVLARRDLSLTVGYGATLLGALPVWCWGDDDQRVRVAGLIRAGGYGAFGLSERDHGSDVTASECVAEPAGDDFLVSGAKWPINNATRSRFMTVFARTGTGPRAFSILLFDKERSATDRWSNEPRVPTMGLRSGDFSGIAFKGCPFPGTSLVGRKGVGLDEALKTLQVTRTLLTSFSLGAADTALRVTLGHVRARRLYGRPVYMIPVIRDQLLSAYLDLLTAECVAVPTSRAVAMAPQRLSLWSAVAKYLVPLLVEEIISGLSTALSAPYFMRDGVADGVFQKLVRDHAIVGVFDGTSHVNLQVVASQLPSLLHTGTGRDTDAVSMPELFSMDGRTPAWNPRVSGLRLTNDGLDEITQSWAEAVAAITKLCAEQAPGVSAAVAAELTDVLDDLDALWRRQRADVHDVVAEEKNLHSGVRGFQLARTHCLLHAAACCVHTWLANRGHPERFPAGAEWLLLCLRRIIDRLNPAVLRGDCVHTGEVEREMMRSFTENRLFSLAPYALGGTFG